MAKASKFPAPGGSPEAPGAIEQNGSPPKPVRKPRPKAAVPVGIQRAAPASPAEPPPAPTPQTDIADTIRLQFQDTISELRTVREQVRAARDETVGALNRVQAEAAAAVTEVAQIAHQCRQTSERLIAELGEQSLAFGRVRQAAEEGKELARHATVSREELRALRADCDATGSALGALANQTIASYQEVFAKAAHGVRALLDEIEAIRARVAEIRQEAESPVPSPTESLAEDHTPKNRFGATVVSAAVVSSVFADSPAAAAGILPGDVIEEVQGHTIQTGGQLRERIQSIASGEDVTLQLRRGGEMVLRTVKLGEGMSTGQDGSRFGVTVESAVMVAEVFVGSPAAAAGLLHGDVIGDAHGQPVQSGEQLLSVIHSQPEGAEVVLIVSRSGARHQLVAHLDRA